MKSLISAYSEVRNIEPRLSGGFKAGEFLPRQDGLQKVSPALLEKASDNLLEAASNEKDLPAQLAYGRLLLLEGKNKAAEIRLRKVLDALPESADARNDLGVALFEQQKLEDALEEFERALEGSPQMAEAIFNRALCYEKLLLTQAAIAEFDHAARFEDGNGWSKEARARIEKLSRPFKVPQSYGEVIKTFDSALSEKNWDEARRIADENFEHLTIYALRDLTLEHLNAAISGDRARSESALVKLEATGRFFIETKGDRYIADSAEYLRRLPEKERPVELKLVNEYLDCINASNSQDSAEREAAFSRLARVAEAFRARGDLARAERADLRVAKNYYESNKLRKSVVLFQAILSLAEKKGWTYDQADVFANLGIIYARLGKDALAIKYCNRAQTIFYRMREKTLEAKMLQYMSIAYRRLGDLDMSLSKSREYLRFTLLNSMRLEELAYTYLDIASVYKDKGNHGLTLLYAEQSRTYSEAINDINRWAQAVSMIALEQVTLQQVKEAKANLMLSFDLVKKVELGKRSFTEPLILLRAGKVALEYGEPSEATGYYSKAVSLATKTEDNKFLLIDSLSGRAASYAAQDKNDLALSDVVQLVRIIENYRADISESKYRCSFLDVLQNAFDQVISLNLTSFGKPIEAFNMSERVRARALLDDIAINARKPDDTTESDRVTISDSVVPLKLNQVQTALPENFTLLQYSVTEKQTYIFIVTRSGFDVVTSPASVELLDRLVQKYLSALKAKAPVEQLREQATELYKYLIYPIKDRIPRNSSVCVVPDKALHFLPFAALVDNEGDYLIKSYKLSYAPSASVLVHCLYEDKKKAGNERERIVAVGNPAFDQEKFQKLRLLPDAEQEVDLSASYYSSRIVLKGEEATESSVLGEIRQSDVAHLALHCIVEEKSPWLAALVLARASPVPAPDSMPQTRDDGVLYLDEVYKIKLPRTRLVVLSACQSGLGQYYRGEGIVSIVRPFISSGVPTVVASLWPVDSQVTAPLMIDFHRQRKQSRNSISEALRAAQINMSNGGPSSHPYYWAPFIAIGSAN